MNKRYKMMKIQFGFRFYGKLWELIVDAAHNLGKRSTTEHNRNLDWVVMTDNHTGKDTNCTWAFLWSISCFFWLFFLEQLGRCKIMLCWYWSALGMIWQVLATYMWLPIYTHTSFLFFHFSNCLKFKTSRPHKMAASFQWF